MPSDPTSVPPSGPLRWDNVLHEARHGNPPPPWRLELDPAEWRRRLPPDVWRVLRGKGTEAPFSSTLCERFEPGRYACAGCGLVLFDARTQFSSGSGWPSFTAPVAAGRVAHHADHSHGLSRIETTCAACDGHLGHVFPDGPPPTGLRYCINALALARLLGEDAGEGARGWLDGQPAERALLAGGCFWGLQDLLRRVPGVLRTRVGYSGGEVANATYHHHGRHAETVELWFDPARLAYRELLALFFRLHDPTTPDRQGNDVGPSYRSAVFVFDERQRQAALGLIAAIEASGRWPGRVVTEVVPAGPFWPAEPEHQDYLLRHPGGYTCHWERPDWVLPGSPD